MWSWPISTRTYCLTEVRLAQWKSIKTLEVPFSWMSIATDISGFNAISHQPLRNWWPYSVSTTTLFVRNDWYTRWTLMSMMSSDQSLIKFLWRGQKKLIPLDRNWQFYFQTPCDVHTSKTLSQRWRLQGQIKWFCWTEVKSTFLRDHETRS